VNKYGYIQNISPVKTAARSRHDWFDFHLQVSPTKVQRVVGFDKTKHHPKIKDFQETKSPVLLKNLLIPDDEDNGWLFNQQSYVSQCANADVPFSYVPNFVKSERSESTSQEASDVSLRELKEKAPNQKVSVHATLSMGAQGPNKIETKSKLYQALSVKEDCILEDETGTMELHIWEPLFTQLKSNKAYYFQNLTLRYYQGSKFLSTNRNTTYSEETTILKKLVDPEILTNTDREIIASQLKYVASLSIFSACQLCKKRIGDESSEREGSVKLCIQHNESELWLTAFKNEIENLLKNTTASTSSTIDEIEDALISLNDVKLKYNSQRNIVKEVLNL
ncbi:unnamed protein product, partial [Porites lobata]